MTSVFSKKARVKKGRKNVSPSQRTSKIESFCLLVCRSSTRERMDSKGTRGEMGDVPKGLLQARHTALGQIVKDASISMLMLVLAQLLPRYGDRLARRNATFFQHRAVCTSDPSRQEESHPPRHLPFRHPWGTCSPAAVVVCVLWHFRRFTKNSVILRFHTKRSWRSGVGEAELAKNFYCVLMNFLHWSTRIELCVLKRSTPAC